MKIRYSSVLLQPDQASITLLLKFCIFPTSFAYQDIEEPTSNPYFQKPTSSNPAGSAIKSLLYNTLGES